MRLQANLRRSRRHGPFYWVELNLTDIGSEGTLRPRARTEVKIRFSSRFMTLSLHFEGFLLID